MSVMTVRDKWLAAAIPALLTLLIGWLVYLRPAGREVAQLRQRVTNQGSLDARKAQVAAAQVDLVELQKSIAEKRAEPAAVGSFFDRNWAMQQISLLCEAHGLGLEKAAPDPSGPLAPLLRESLPAIGNTGTAPQVWRVEVSGNYPAVVKLLAGLEKAKPLIVPLNISMQTGKTERHPSFWVLTLWL